MKKLLILIAGVMVMGSMAGSVYAQAAGPQGGGVQQGAGQQQGPDKGGKKGGHAPVNQKVLKQLNLTAEQQTKIKELVKNYAQDVKEAREKTASGAKPDRKAMKEMREKFQSDLKAILTPEQQAQLKKLMDEAKKKKDGDGGKAPVGGKTGKGGGGR